MRICREQIEAVYSYHTPDNVGHYCDGNGPGEDLQLILSKLQAWTKNVYAGLIEATRIALFTSARDRYKDRMATRLWEIVSGT